MRVLRLALVPVALVAVAGVWLVVHPAPPAKNTGLFQGSQIDSSTLALFQRSCQNCHSENTRWPWYSRIPPGSWMIQSDIDTARRHVDFSRWTSYGPDQQQELLIRIGSVVRTGQMPLRRYTWLHPEAVLVPRERQQIYQWTRTERKRLGSLLRRTGW